MRLNPCTQNYIILFSTVLIIIIVLDTAMSYLALTQYGFYELHPIPAFVFGKIGIGMGLLILSSFAIGSMFWVIQAIQKEWFTLNNDTKLFVEGLIFIAVYARLPILVNNGARLLTL